MKTKTREAEERLQDALRRFDCLLAPLPALHGLIETGGWVVDLEARPVEFELVALISRKMTKDSK